MPNTFDTKRRCSGNFNLMHDCLKICSEFALLNSFVIPVHFVNNIILSEVHNCKAGHFNKHLTGKWVNTELWYLIVNDNYHRILKGYLLSNDQVMLDLGRDVD